MQKLLNYGSGYHIFFIWTEGEDKFERFLNHPNNFHSNLKFSHEKSTSSVNFLDVTISIVYIVDNKFETNLFCKPKDCHHFLNFNSAYLFHNKKSIVYNQGLHIKRLCSSPLTFKKHLENLKNLVLSKRIPSESCRCPNWKSF